MCICLGMCKRMHMVAEAADTQARVRGGCKHLMWVPGTKVRSSARAACIHAFLITAGHLSSLVLIRS